MAVKSFITLVPGLDGVPGGTRQPGGEWNLELEKIEFQ